MKIIWAAPDGHYDPIPVHLLVLKYSVLLTARHEEIGKVEDGKG